MIKSICFICPEYPPGPNGGIGTITQIAARELVKRGVKVRVVGVYPHYYPLKLFELDNGVEVYRIKQNKFRFSWPFYWYKQYRLIRKWIRNNEIDVVEAPDSRGWIAFWPKLPIPLLLRAHGSNTYFSYLSKAKISRVTRFIEKKSYSRAWNYTGVSSFACEKTKAAFKMKRDIVNIPYGIEIIQSVNKITRLENSIVFAGTLIEKKGLLSLIDALTLVKKENIHFKLDIFGKDTINKSRGSMKEHIMKILKKNNLDTFVTFHGHIDKQKWYSVLQQATLAIFPSYMETFGLVAIEAMMCECPTIFTKATSGPEIINNYEDGILINPSDSNEIASAIMFLLKNPQKRKVIGENGRKKVISNFSTKIMVDKLINFYTNECTNFKKNMALLNE